MRIRFRRCVFVSCYLALVTACGGTSHAAATTATTAITRGSGADETTSVEETGPSTTDGYADSENERTTTTTTTMATTAETEGTTGEVDISCEGSNCRPTFEWVTTVSASYGFGAKSLAVDDQGSVYAIGYFADTIDFDPGAGERMATSRGGTDIFVQKIDRMGNLVWLKTLGTENDDYGFTLSLAPNGDLYAAGFFGGTLDVDPNEGQTLLTSNGLTDVFIVRWTAEGDFVWGRSVGGPNNEMAYALTTDAQSNVYVTGWFAETADFDPGPGTELLRSVGLADAFVLKLDPAGALVWARSFGGDASDEAFSIAVDDVGNVYTAGWYVETVDFDPGLGVASFTSTGGTDGFVHKLDADGDFVWVRTIGSGGDDYVTGLAMRADSEIVVTGRFSGEVNFGNAGVSNTLTSLGAFDVFVLQLNAEGTSGWARSVGGVSDDYGNGIAIDAQSNVYVVGSFRNTVDFDPGADLSELTSAGVWDDFLLKLDGEGTFSWARRFGGPNNDRSLAVTVAPSGDIFTSGYFEGPAELGLEQDRFVAEAPFGAFIQKLGQRAE